MQKLIDAYIQSKASSWSPTSQRSERYRLRAIREEHLTDPAALYKYLTEERELSPYAVKTTFIRAGELLEFAMQQGFVPNGANVVKQWMEQNNQHFKHAYKKKPVTITFEDAIERIAKIDNEDARSKAMQLLATGMRFAESNTLDENGQVIGKGGASRTVPLAHDYKTDFKKGYTTLYFHLKKVGLTPHMLRKLCATKMAQMGAREADLMALFGWRSSQVASLYVQAQREKEFAERMKETLAKSGKKEKS